VKKKGHQASPWSICFVRKKKGESSCRQTRFLFSGGEKGKRGRSPRCILGKGGGRLSPFYQREEAIKPPLEKEGRRADPPPPRGEKEEGRRSAASALGGGGHTKPPTLSSFPGKGREEEEKSPFFEKELAAWIFFHKGKKGDLRTGRKEISEHSHFHAEEERGERS